MIRSICFFSVILDVTIKQRNMQRYLGISHWKQCTCSILQGDQHSTRVERWFRHFSFWGALYTRSGAGGSRIKFFLLPLCSPFSTSPPFSPVQRQVLFKDADVGRIGKNPTDAFGQRVVARNDMHSGRRKQRILFFHYNYAYASRKENIFSLQDGLFNTRIITCKNYYKQRIISLMIILWKSY